MKMRLPQKVFGKTGAFRWSAFLLSLGVLRALALTPEVDVRRDTTVAAIEQVMPSVVNIRTSQLVRRNDSYESIFRRFYGLDDKPQIEERPSDIGSGVIVDEVGEEGYILTNVHVVQRANRVQVQLWDGREYEAVVLLGTSQKDLALLRIVRRPGDKPFRPITMAKDDDLLLGETVIAVGNPFGLGGSVSRGILSSKNRRSDAGGRQLDFPDWLQTDADINPGNSGGPLINIRGELIGINAAVYATDQGKGTGFAIPIKQVSSALSDFFTLEWSAKLWLGARFRGAPYPLTVREVQNGSPADQAGLRVGQEVVEVNGKPVRSLAAFNQFVAAGANRQAAVTVLENGVRRVLKLELVPLIQLNRQLILKRLGLSTAPLTEAQAASYKLSAAEGLLVEEVEKDSPAAGAQLQAGMVVTALDGVAVSDLVNISNVLGNKKRGETVQLAVKVANRYGSGLVRVLNGQVDLVVR
jgi:serine protease Do